MDKLTPDLAGKLLTNAEFLQERKSQEKTLEEFVRGAWHVLEPARALIWNWHLSVLCAYLEAVDRREIHNLIINIPPGTMKSLIVSVFYPSWVWLHDPSHRFLCGSNAEPLATRDAMKMRMLVESEWFQERWSFIQISRFQREKKLYMNTKMGHRESQGVTAKVTGKRGDTIIWDDPHDTKTAESDVQRQEILDAYDTAWSSRKNDLGTSAFILIMQRVHHQDITNHFLKKRAEGQHWTLLAIPMRFEFESHDSEAPAVKYDADKDIGRPDLNDPRTVEGELMFPERFPEHAVRTLEQDLHAYGTAGQLQQRPSPRGGGELKKTWWRTYRIQAAKKGNRYIIVDPAGEKREARFGKRSNTAMIVVEMCQDRNLYVLDVYRDRLGLIERTDILFKWHRDYRPLGVGYEKYGMQSDIAHIEDRMEREGYRFVITELGGTLNKLDRIRKLIPWFSGYRIWWPETLVRTNFDGKQVDLMNDIKEQEYLPFPVSSYYDVLDVLARICDEDMKIVEPSAQPDKPVRVRVHRPKDRGMGL